MMLKSEIAIIPNIKTAPQNYKMIQKRNIYLTFTICGAADSADMPRQQSRATSAGKASQTPSLQITSLPPAVDS